ncbi:MAG: hypothetical protein ABSF16_11145 [Terracidiphilus sp.]|jgi:RNA polymerase subunit RPABC4/transcription elongation factor Spt4
MEITCSRCHQTVQTDDCYCPACGLPQLLYTSEGVAGQAQPEQWSEAVRDASEVSWRPALRAALILAVPAGLLCSIMSPVSILCFLWISAAASWAVVLYMRSQRSGWITIGAGARIGLVTGLLGAWTAAAATGISLFVMRFILHQGKQFDDLWQDSVQQRVTPLIAQQWASMGIDIRAWLLSPEGRAGMMLSFILFFLAVLILFAVGGGALGARLVARTRRPEV